MSQAQQQLSQQIGNAFTGMIIILVFCIAACVLTALWIAYYFLEIRPRLHMKDKLLEEAIGLTATPQLPPENVARNIITPIGILSPEWEMMYTFEMPWQCIICKKSYQGIWCQVYRNTNKKDLTFAFISHRCDTLMHLTAGEAKGIARNFQRELEEARKRIKLSRLETTVSKAISKVEDSQATIRVQRTHLERLRDE